MIIQRIKSCTVREKSFWVEIKRQYSAGTREFHIDEPTVVSIGKFDGLHRGHRKLLREMLHWKEMGYKVAIFTFSTPPGALVERTMQTMIMTNAERVSLLQ